MSIRLSACYAFVAALFGLAVTATTPAHAYVEAGMLAVEARGRQALLSYRRVFSTAFSRRHPARRRSIIAAR
jgi:hypothetical protein